MAGVDSRGNLHQHPGLSLAEVHAALTYYYDHREELLSEIQADRFLRTISIARHPDSSQ